MTIREAKQVPIVDFLFASGHNPTVRKGADAWYLSPFRREVSPSFKVNTNRNVWFDHGAGTGGTIIDLVQHLHEVDISGALSVLSNQAWAASPSVSFHQEPLPDRAEYERPGITIKSAKLLNSQSLIRYLESRFIPVAIGRMYLRECRYSVPVKSEAEPRTFYGLGFANDLGGYELRNQFAQCSSSPKAITTINPGGSTVAVFEGFFDMLSAFVHYKKNKPAQSIIVLNSVSLLRTALPTLMSYERVNLFLDNDQAGRKAVEVIQQNHSCVTDYSCKIYPNHKDFNDFLINE